MPNAGDDGVEGRDAASPTDDPGASGATVTGGGKASKKAAKATRREAEKATRAAKREAKAAREAAAKAARKAAEKAEAQAAKARKAAKQAAKAAGREAKAAEKEARRAARGAEAGAAEAVAGVAAAEAVAGVAAASDAGAPADTGPARGLTGAASGMARAAGSLLSEVAGLVRQATEPAASRIVDRVTSRPGAEPQPEVPVEAEAAEPEGAVAEGDAASHDAAEVAAVELEVAAAEAATETAEPEPDVAAEPEPELEAAEPATEVAEPEVAEPEPDVAAEPEPEPGALAEPELDSLAEPAPEPEALAEAEPEGAEPATEVAEPDVAEPGPDAAEPELEVAEPEPEPEPLSSDAADLLAPADEAVDASPDAAFEDPRAAIAWPVLDQDLIPVDVSADAPAEPEAVVGADAEPEPEPDAQPPSDAVGEALAEAEPAAQPEPEPEPEPEAIPEPYQDPWAYLGVAMSSPPPAEPEPEPEAQPDVPDTAPPAIEIPPGAVIGAAIDVGATSVHLLVAAVGGHRVEPLLDESSFLGLGDRIAADGRLGPEAREELVAALVGYADTARQLGASRITVVGTEPMRRADDAATVVHAVEARAGVALHILDHDEEGLLMLLGVTKGRPITSNLLVIDVGGGSSEFVVVDPAGHEHAMGLPLGAARLTRDLVRSDPPSLAELEALKVRVREILVDAPGVNPGEIVAVGGTASNLLKLLPATALDRVLTRRRLTVALAMLTVERSLEAAERHLVRPARARILPAGAIIVDAILERYGADRLRVSEEGIREGLALAAAAAGPAWRDRLPQLVRGWADEDWPLE